MIITGKKIRRDLNSIGFNVNSVDDLVNSKEPYPDAVPILKSYLDNDFEGANLAEAVVRALTVKEARGAVGAALLSLYERTSKQQFPLRWAIGNAMTVVMTPDDLGKVLEIVKNKENGISRQMFVLALRKFKESTDVEKTLIGLLSDDEVVIHAINALRKIKSIKARKKIERLVDSPIPVVGKLAKEYLEKIK